MFLLLVLLILSLSPAYSEDLCIREVHNPYSEVYVSYAFMKSIERAVLESGNRIGCGVGSKEIKPEVELLKETPIAYTPRQRISAYNLELKVSLTLDGKKRTFFASVPYSQPGGGVGDLPRRKAVEDAFKIIYVDILDFIKRR